MKANIAFLLILTLLNSHHFSKIHTNFKQCDKRKPTFNKCLSETLQYGIEQLKEPLEEYNLPKIDPLIGPEEMIAEYGDETNGLRQKYTNFKIFGLTNISATNATFDFERKVLDLNITFFECLVEFHYDVIGRFILLPINVSTTGSCNLIKPLFKMSFNLKENKNENQTHYRVIRGGRLEFFPEAIEFRYNDIFKSKCMNDEINRGMSENWKTIAKYWQGMFPRLFMDTFEEMLDNFLKNVPSEELFASS